LRALRLVLQITAIPLLLLTLLLLMQWQNAVQQEGRQRWGDAEIERRLLFTQSALKLFASRQIGPGASFTDEETVLSAIEAAATDTIAILLKPEADLSLLAELSETMELQASQFAQAAMLRDREQRSLLFHRTAQQVRSAIALYDASAKIVDGNSVAKSRLYGWALQAAVGLALFNAALLFVLGRQLLRIERGNEQERARVSRANKTLATYVSVLRDEVNSPLASGLHSIQELQSKLAGQEQQVLLGRIQRSVQSVLSVVQSMMGFDQAPQRAPLLLSPTSVHQCVDTCFRIVRFSASDSVRLHYNIEASVPDYIMSDTLWLSQILLNLLSNSVKFTREGSIELDVNIREIDGNRHICFELSDTGIGIADDKLQTIFESYRQADDTIQQEFGGTGLGLSVLKKLVDDLGGSIQVSSKLDVGTRFTLLFPLDTGFELPVMPEASTARVDSRQANRLQVLVAEDNAINQLVAQRMLEKLGCEVQVVADGQQAVEIARSQEFDLILMDLQMPVMDGIEATRMILSEADAAPLIVAMTANVLENERQRSLEAGMADFVSKPITLDVLRDCLDKHSLLPEGQQLFDS
jgi:signal transduction histidine kinase/ActR/RegA family two-component response regulator